MPERTNGPLAAVASCLLLATASHAQITSDIQPLLRCQKTIAKAGARFANKTVKSTLRCTNAVVECQVNCDEGVYGPSCQSNPPPCCDSDDPGSNASFQVCMDEAEARCDKENAKIVDAEQRKRDSIASKCAELTLEQLCGAGTPGLNFGQLSAGCQALIPGWTCDLNNLLECVGGPMEEELSGQIAELLDPRAGEALTAAGLTAQFAGISTVYKVKGQLTAGKTDVFSIEGRADEKIVVAVRTMDDTGSDTSTLEPVLTYIGTDGTTPVGSTSIVSVGCATPTTCGASCPTFKRRFPFTGTFFLTVTATENSGCGAGAYQLVVKTDGGSGPMLVADDVDSITP
jgi:hypothetical protein